MTSVVTIVADVHEEKSRIASLLEELGAIVERAPLAAGDYLVGADTIVERKRVLDLHSAIAKGRLWAQIGKLRSSCPFPYLLVEGTNLDRGPLHPNAIRGACLAGISMGTARALLERFGSVAGVLQADPDEWLDVPGVGRERARALAEVLTHRWGSPS